MKRLTTCLLALLIVLILIDLGTGLFFYNRLNLVFDSTNFNNILTPVISLLGLLVNGFVLLFLIKQTRIIQSQNIKPFFIMRIDWLKQEMEKINIVMGPGSHQKEILGLDSILAHLERTISVLEINKEYVNFFKKGNVTVKESDIENSLFFDRIFLVTQLVNPKTHISKLFQKVINLIGEINSSNLLIQDKDFLLGKIRSEILENYIVFFSKLKAQELPDLFIPVLYANTKNDKVDVVKLSQSRFASCYNDFFNNPGK